MKPILAEWNIIVAGSWNLAILNPDWVSKKIFETNELDVDLLIDNFRPQIRYKHEKVILAPESSRVTVGCTETTEAAIEQAEAACLRLIDSLPVTPLSAVGINVGFFEDNPSGHLLDGFNFKDNFKYAENGFEVATSEILRSISLPDCTLNFRVRQEADGNVSFHFNFHANTQDAENAKLALKKKASSRVGTATDILKKIYGIVGDDA